jgi:hypothetical protein
MKNVLAVLAILSLLAAPAAAEVCSMDVAPAATLLLPYFEVDYADPNGRTTLFSINNSSDKATLAHVVLWTDLAVPTLAFDVYLTGYDVQTINLRDILVSGRIPRTADDGHDPADQISPQGDFSRDTAFPNCAGLPPPLNTLPANFLAHLRAAHTGAPSSNFGEQCAGVNHGDAMARGYVTVDVVKSCSVLVPGDPGYFAAGGEEGVVGYDNVLWGDFFYVDKTGSFARGDNLVRLEADPERFGAGDRTFYARYVNGSGADGREPLPSIWGSRYLSGGAFSGGTDLIVWRNQRQPAEPFACNSPEGFPVQDNQVLIFDEEENVVELNPPCNILCPPVVPFTPFSANATRVAVGSATLPPVFDFGWILADLRFTPFGGLDPFDQAWVGQQSSASGRYSVGLSGTAMNDVCTPQP